MRILEREPPNLTRRRRITMTKKKKEKKTLLLLSRPLPVPYENALLRFIARKTSSFFFLSICVYKYTYNMNIYLFFFFSRLFIEVVFFLSCKG